MLGTGRYWVDADPQMVAIVLMGNVGTVSNARSDEHQVPRLALKLGRYAVLVQLLKAMDKLDHAARVDKRLKTFAEQLENRIAVALDAEVSFFAILCSRISTDLVGEGSQSARRLSSTDMYAVLSAP
jgi:hypothetical protein